MQIKNRKNYISHLLDSPATAYDLSGILKYIVIEKIGY